MKDLNQFVLFVIIVRRLLAQPPVELYGQDKALARIVKKDVAAQRARMADVFYALSEPV